MPSPRPTNSLVRERLTPPERQRSGSHRTILFRHPGYPDTANALLSLGAVDKLGIDYDVALAACGIVAGNRWHQAWFGVRNEDEHFQRVNRPEDGILPCLPDGSHYYFFVGPDEEEKYAVVPSFGHWLFPHNDLPPVWQGLVNDLPDLPLDTDAQQATRVRDRSCRITGFFEATEAAHLVPREAAAWFEANNMERYCRVPNRTDPIDDDANMMLIRRDLHSMFDRQRFALVPKSQHPCPIVHVLIPGGFGELQALYHNRPLQPSPTSSGVCSEFLFARFAWAIFSDEIYRFLKLRSLLYYVLSLDIKTGKRNIREMKADAVQLHIFPSTTRNRSVSPQKRKRSTPEEADDDTSDDDYVSGGIGRQDEDSQPASEASRGRSRWRFFSDASPPRSSPSGVSSSFSNLERKSPHRLPDLTLPSNVPGQCSTEAHGDAKDQELPRTHMTSTQIPPGSINLCEDRLRSKKRRRTSS
ncbi:hypothetical protein F4825DRAFT_429013 [Nemania diffusa]|nr:hypothetical protein F4825DRAFT_429013 [Nemania diffusa]